MRLNRTNNTSELMEQGGYVQQQAKVIQLFIESGNFQEAYHHIILMTETAPDNMFSHILAAEFFEQLNKSDEAIIEWAIILALAPDHPFPYQKISRYLEESMRPEVADRVHLELKKRQKLLTKIIHV